MRWTIRKKLLSTFMVINVLLIFISFIGIFEMNQMGNQTKEIDSKWVKSITLAGEIESQWIDLERLVLLISLASSLSEIEKLEVQVSEQMKKLQASKAEFGALMEGEDLTLYNEFLTESKGYYEFIGKMTEAARENRLDHLAIHINNSRSYFNSGNKHLKDFIAENSEKVHELTTKSVETVEEGKRLLTLITVIGFILSFSIALLMSKNISNPISKITDQSIKIASGNLSFVSLEIKNKDELGILANNFNIMVQNLRDTVGQVIVSAEQVASMSEELSASAEETSKGTQIISESIQEVATGSEKQVESAQETYQKVNEISKGMEQVEKNIQVVVETSSTANDTSIKGNKVVKQTLQHMSVIEIEVDNTAKAIRSLGDKSGEIKSIVTAISDIAGQTNLLALNAAIEAARAGEHGKGFAVVADEVRKLAEQSDKSAKDIATLIIDIQKGIEESINAMNKGIKAVQEGNILVADSGQTFEEIAVAIEQMTSQAQEVSVVVEQVNASSHSMVKLIEILTNVSEETAGSTQTIAASIEEQTATMEEIASSTNVLANAAEELQVSTRKFTL